MILDVSVLIAHADSGDAHHDQAAELLLARAAERFAVSPLTLAEFLVGPARAGRLDAAEEYVERLEVVSIALPDDAPRRLARLRADTGLRLPDCCVLLTARQTGDDLATFDVDLQRQARGLGLAVA